MLDVETVVRRAREIARANGHPVENIGTWESAVIKFLAISRAVQEIEIVSRGKSEDL